MRVMAFVLMFGYAFCGYIPDDRPDEGADWSDVALGPISLITKYKYPAEQHYITTQDGYILSLIRIPYGRMCPRKNSKGVVVLQHGLFYDCFNFILPGTKRGLAYILADMCYDVWMMNSRGSSLSMGHVNYTINDYEYWDFSWHEIGVYDLPAVTDYVLNKTGVESYTYVGHSQGTTSFFVFGCLRPEHARKVNGAFLMAPIAYMSNAESLILRIFSGFPNLLKSILDMLKIYSLLQKNTRLTNIIGTFCSTIRPIHPFFCELILFEVYGYDIKGINMTIMTIQLQQELGGSSVKEVIHFLQMVASGKFRHYDYGIRNLQIYGQLSPPDYDLTKVRVPVHLYYSQNDRILSVKDEFRTMKELPNVQENYLIPYKHFNHIGHFYAKDIIDLEYDHLVKQIDRIYGK